MSTTETDQKFIIPAKRDEKKHDETNNRIAIALQLLKSF